MRRGVLIPIGLAALLAGCATFTGEIPVGTEVTQASYLSPRNIDGIKDTLDLPIRVDAPYDRMVLGGYRFTIQDSAGGLIYATEVAAIPQGTTARTAAPGAEIPQRLSWDGKTDTGEWAADGEYTWGVEVWDTKGNTGATPRFPVIVDNTPPTLTLGVAQPLFSPDGDGNLDVLVVEQTDSSTEDSWQGEVRDDLGRVVQAMVWTGQAVSFSWDGSDASGTRVPDGVYVYSVTAKDRAGNSATFTARGITVDTNPVSVELGLTWPWLSPNGDGVRDIVQLLPRVALPETVTAWSVELLDAEGATRRLYRGTGNTPERVEFDGRDDAGEILPDGLYTARLLVAYPNGAVPAATSPPLAIDTVAPRIRVAVDFPVFSPDGDGRRDAATFTQTSSSEDRWSGRVQDAQGRVVLVRSWVDMAESFVWDGRDDAGWALPDGAYVYVVESTDAAGNTTTETVSNLRLDRRPTAVTLGSSVSAFSPNGDGVLDTVDFFLTARPADGVDVWKLTVVDTHGRIAISFGGQGLVALPSWIQWDGKNIQGRVVEGALRAELVVGYQHGNTASVSLDLTVDLTPPTLTAQVSPRWFSPDGDGLDDLLSVSIDAQDPSGFSGWSARVMDPEGRLFHQWRASGAPPALLTWDGRSATGELVQAAADYGLDIQAVDGAGNSTTVRAPVSVDILVLREGARLRIVISSIYFKEFTADYRAVPADRARGNLQTLDRLAERLSRYPEHQIRVEGHAVSVYWDDAVRGRTEETEVLQPLSLDRARAVRAALVERGVSAQRLTAVGFGGTQPVVPHGDLQNRWKNRRVEFVLERR